MTARGQAVSERVESPVTGSQASRRTVLLKLGRFAAATPPTVGLMLAAASKPAHSAIVSQCQDDIIDNICVQ